MKLPKSKLLRSGIVLLLAGPTVFFIWAFWLQSRNTRPVDIPIKLAAGTIRIQEFKLNQSGLYTIEIEAWKCIPFETLNCLLGVGLDLQQLANTGESCRIPPAIHARWTLRSSGLASVSGNSDNDAIGVWSKDTITREIGTFQGQSGHTYLLEVESLSDGSALSATDPHLKVEIHPEFYVSTAWMSFSMLRKCKAVSALGLGLLLLWGARGVRRVRMKHGSNDSSRV